MHRFIKLEDRWLVSLHNPKTPPTFGSVFEVTTKAGQRRYVRIARVLRAQGNHYICSFETFAETRRRQQLGLVGTPA